MANVAGFQNTMGNPAPYLLGVPTVDLLDGYTQGAVAIEDLPIGGAAFITDRTSLNLSAAAITTTTPPQLFGGVVTRSNAVGMSYADVMQGYSQTIEAGKNAQLLTRGSIPVNIAVANEAGAIPLVGSVVWVINATGLFETQSVGGTAPAGAQATNFRVQVVPTGWTANSLVVITNIQNVGV